MSAIKIILVSLFLCASASAEIITLGPYTGYPAVGSGLVTMNWNSTITLPQWNPCQGCTLLSVKITMAGTVTASVKFENVETDPEGADIDTEVTGDLTLKRPDNSTLVVATPYFLRSDHVSAYDGTTDYAGTSGMTFASLGNSGSNVLDTSDAAILLLFTGPGNLALPVSAVSATTLYGPGNLDSQVTSLASAYATVEYTVDAPEPATVTTGLASLLLLGFAWRKRRS